MRWLCESIQLNIHQQNRDRDYDTDGSMKHECEPLTMIYCCYWHRKLRASWVSPDPLY